MAEKCVAIVLAAGRGKRMKSRVQKQFLMLQNKPVLYYSLKVFEESFVDEIILVTGKSEKEFCRKEIVEKYGFKKVSKIVEGGEERYHSVINGIEAAVDCDFVFIHDGARPFIDSGILQRGLDGVRENNACVVGMPVKDTIKIVNEENFCTDTPKRSLVWQVQTPQVFSYPLIKEAYEKLRNGEEQLKKQKVLITDDAMVVEYFTQNPVKMVEGSYRNIKITTPEDMSVAEAFFEELKKLKKVVKSC